MFIWVSNTSTIGGLICCGRMGWACCVSVDLLLRWVICKQWSVICKQWSVICNQWSVICNLWFRIQSAICDPQSAYCACPTRDGICWFVDLLSCWAPGMLPCLPIPLSLCSDLWSVEFLSCWGVEHLISHLLVPFYLIRLRHLLLKEKGPSNYNWLFK